MNNPAPATFAAPGVPATPGAPAKRYAFMDVLNVVAIFAVMLLHVSLNIEGMRQDLAWDVALVYQCVAIFAVPIFLMVSGANLLGYRERYSTATFFKKRALRVVVTLVVWSAVMFLLLCFASPLLGYEPRRFGLVPFVTQLLTNNVIGIYWFFYVIIGLYAVTPILSIIAANKRVLEYTLVLAAALSIGLPALDAFAPAHLVTDPLALRFFTPWLTYYLLGFYLTRYVQRTFAPGALVAACVTCVALMLGLTWWLNAGHVGQEYNTLFAAAEGLPTLVYAAALFMLFKRADERLAKSRCYPAFRCLSALSLKVYAVHLPLIWMFNTHVLSAFVPNSAAALLMQFVAEPMLAYAASLLIAWLIEKAKAALKARLKSKVGK